LSIDLFKKLSAWDPSLRYIIEDALKHPFITGHMSDEIPRTIVEELNLLENYELELTKANLILDYYIIYIYWFYDSRRKIKK